MGKFYSTKTYGNEEGLSCVFRQWRSTHSHCSTLHGYAIGIRLKFECAELDERNWVFDFGGLKEFKTWMKYMFDHTVLVAKDDPLLSEYEALAKISTSEIGDRPCERGALLDLRVVENVGCEAFAKLAFDTMQTIINRSVMDQTALNPSARVKSVEVFEHGANSAIYERQHYD